MFVMKGENMAFTTELAVDGKDLPKGLFLDIMIEKTQMLHTHLKHLHLRLVLVANIGENMATVKIYDTFVEDSLKLHFTFQICGTLKISYIDYGLKLMEYCGIIKRGSIY